MQVPPPLYRAWEAQHVAAERARLIAQHRTEKRLAEARRRVREAIRALADAARIEVDAVR
jgi:hypothetical protein